MKRFFITTLLGILVVSSPSFGVSDYLSILRTLNTDALQHPYLLLFNQQDRQFMLQQINNDPKLAEIMEALKRSIIR